nr:LruC domain-containing protein [Bacteroidota bacterium]
MRHRVNSRGPNRIITLAVLLTAGILFSSCELPLKGPAGEDSAQSAPFDYSTTADVAVQGTFRTGSGDVMPGVPFFVYTELPNSGVRPIASGSSDANGGFSLTVNIPTAVTQLYLSVRHIGLPSLYRMPVSQHTAAFRSAEVVNQTLASYSGLQKVSMPKLKYLGDWTNNGTPKYLEKTPDIIDAALLARLDVSLPEAVPVTKHHPAYITTEDKSILIQERADVWVTFIHEGAGYQNVLGFYTYPKGEPPATPDDVKEITIVFPNASYEGSGGGLQSGDKVYIGRFDAGVEIGWALFSNGFSGGKLTAGNWMLFSSQQLNGVSDPALRQHTVLLNDVGFGRVILGFEDIKRTTGGDQDFNDCLFSITSNPVKAIVVETLPEIDVPKDADADGVSDAGDMFPNDPERAFISHTPAEGQFNTLAFEDLWPGKGDEDYNDLVMGYSTRVVTNAKNEAVDISTTYVVRAIGATNTLGFGVELPVDPSAIRSSSVSRAGLTKQPLNSNGTEAGQPNAVFILFDNAYEAMNHKGSKFLNTTAGSM